MKSRASSSSPSNNRHPWYYVPKNPYLTEQKLSAKYESCQRRQKQNEKINNYFNKCQQETKLFSNWNQNKHLVKHNSNAQNYHRVESPPFYIEKDEKQLKIDKQIQDEYIKTISKYLQEYKNSVEDFKKNSIDCNEAVQYLFQKIESFELIKKKRKDFFDSWKRYSTMGQNYNHYSNNPLRQVSFLMIELLIFYQKHLSENLRKLKLQIFPIELLFNSMEQKELEEFNQRSIQIIGMYLQLNQQRDKHFQNMFHEERESQWIHQKPIWEKEIQVWDNLFIKLFNSNYSIIRSRVDEIQQKQQESLKKRLDKLDKLKNFIEDFPRQHDYHHSDDGKFKSILYFDIEQF